MRKLRFSKSALLGICALPLVAFALTGCTWIGGGILPSSSGNSGQSAQFSFWFSATGDSPENVSFNANGSYNDRYWSNGPVKITLDQAQFQLGEDDCYFAVTTYKAGKQSGGTAFIDVCDSNQNGPSNGDWFSIVLCGGVYDGYSNEGYITQGNIKQVKS
jgi:hypothetical protein